MNLRTMARTMDRRLLTILLVVFVGIAGASLILPILPLYAERQFGLTPEWNTLLNTAFFGAQFLAGPYLGRLSDKYGRVPVLIVSQVGTVISFLMIAFAPTAGWLFAARILDGITGGNIIVAQAYIIDITPPEKRTQALGYIFAAFGLGFMFGPVIGGLLAAAYGVQVPYIIAAIAAFAGVVLTWVALNESLTPAQRLANQQVKKSGVSLGELMRNTPLLLIFVITFIGQFAFGLFQSTFSLYSAATIFKGYTLEATTLGIGLLFAVIGLTQLFTQAFLLRRVLKKLSEPTVVQIGNVLRMLGLLAYALITTPWLGPIGSFCFAMGMGFSMPALQSLATRTVPDQVRGGVLGIYQSVANLAIVFSTALAGLIFAVGPRLPLWLGAILTAVAILPTLPLARMGAYDRPQAGARWWGWYKTTCIGALDYQFENRSFTPT